MAIRYSIHPAIGIARVGDSELYDADGRTPKPESYFIGPEQPGPDFEPGPYDEAGTGREKFRDSDGALRRQAARFRVYEKEIDDFGRVVSARELNNESAQITWEIHIANKKGAGERFPPYYLDEIPERLRLRNWSVQDRSSLIIEATAKLSQTDKPRRLHGKFLGKKVKLGDVMTDEKGHLIFLGGHGEADSPNGTRIGMPLLPRHTKYNNDGWHDDTSDGWVSAKIKIGNSPSFEVDDRAWVIVAPPDHAPAVQNPVTLYDVVFQANLPHRSELVEPQRPSFTRDIYPLLRRAVDLQWVSQLARSGHGPNTGGEFLRDDIFVQLSSNAPVDMGARRSVFSRLTPPGTPGPAEDMPKVLGGVDPYKPFKKPPPSDVREYGIPLTFTPYQFAVLDLWVKGVFRPDWKKPIPPEPLSDQIDRAAIEPCCGGAFHPGIEAPYIMARTDTYGSWFRISLTMAPGDLTEGLAVPWHTDFEPCTILWWPAQRPNFVFLRPGDQDSVAVWSRGARHFRDLLKLGFIKNDADSGEKLEFERELPEPPPAV